MVCRTFLPALSAAVCAVLSTAVLSTAVLTTAATLTLNAQPGTGAGTQSWVAEGATYGDDLAGVGGTASTYVGKQKNRMLLVPIADAAGDPADSIYGVTVRALTRSDVDLRGTYDGLVVTVSTAGFAHMDAAIDEVALGYGYYEHTWPRNPATGAAWTWSDVNLIEAGVTTAKSAKPTDMVLFTDYVEVVVEYGSGNAPPFVSDVAISGVPAVGELVTGSYTYGDTEGDPEGNSLFRWYRADDAIGTNKAALSACTTATIEIPVSAEGKYVFFEVTPVASTGIARGEPVESAPIGPVAPAVGSAPTATAVLISGIDTVGGTLYASYMYDDADGDLEGASEFEWVRNGFTIAGASGLTYTLTAEDEGASLVFEVTPVASTGTPKTGIPVASSAFGPIQAASGSAPVAQGVAISGADTVGRILTGTYTYFDADGDAEGTSTFRWLRDGVAIDGATGAEYTLTLADEGASMIFEVTPVAAAGTPSRGAPVLSAPYGPISPIPGAAPQANDVTIQGTPLVGDTLTGSYTYSDADGDLEGASAYRWLRDGAAIDGATSLTYVLTDSDNGAMIIFEVTPIASTGAPAAGTAVQSAAVGPIGGATQTLPRSGLEPVPHTSAVTCYDLRGRILPVRRMPAIQGIRTYGVVIERSKDAARSRLLRRP